MSLQIDTERTRRVATSLVARADDLHHARCDHAVLVDHLQLEPGGWLALRPLQTAIEATWELGTFASLLADAVEAGDAFDAAAPGSLAVLLDLADGLAGRRGIVGEWRELLGASGPIGELGQTYDAELRTPYTIFGATPLEVGRNLVLRALADTADGHQIRPDEFGLVQMGPEHFVVVLPGVTDLSHPDWALSDEHRTVRDLDRYAVPSSRSSSVADNRYAQMVVEGLERAGVPAGAHLAVVGHSFGADTALDLAADADFGARYDVSHVVAAGYWSQPQLADVSPDVEVLVLQNSVDAAVLAESVGHSSLAQAVEARASAGGSLLDGDLGGAWSSTIDAIGHEVDAVVGAGEFLADHTDELVTISAGWSTMRFDVVASEAIDVVRLDAGVHRSGSAVVDVFDGGGRGAGHHPANYITHLDEVDDPQVEAFLASLGAAGFDGWGAAVAVDVSVPDR